HEVSELHPIKREVALVPLLAPLLDHEGEEITVLPGASGVRLTLVPDDSLDAVAERGINDAAENVAGARVTGKPLKRGGRLTERRVLFGFRLFNVLFPLGHLFFVVGLGFLT